MRETCADPHLVHPRLFATTTGQKAGFLDGPTKSAEVTFALRQWKSESLQTGAWWRFYSVIERMTAFATSPSIVQRELAAFLDGQQKAASKHTLEACTALVLAGSDPTITHILTTLFYIYRDTALLQRLRDEIWHSGISPQASFKQLIYSTPKMPLLHAVMDEALRLHQPHTSGFKYVSPLGGVIIGDEHVPQGVSHSIIRRPVLLIYVSRFKINVTMLFSRGIEISHPRIAPRSYCPFVAASSLPAPRFCEARLKSEAERAFRVQRLQRHYTICEFCALTIISNLFFRTTTSKGLHEEQY